MLQNMEKLFMALSFVFYFIGIAVGRQPQNSIDFLLQRIEYGNGSQLFDSVQFVQIKCEISFGNLH